VLASFVGKVFANMDVSDLKYDKSLGCNNGYFVAQVCQTGNPQMIEKFTGFANRILDKMEADPRIWKSRHHVEEACGVISDYAGKFGKENSPYEGITDLAVRCQRQNATFAVLDAAESLQKNLGLLGSEKTNLVLMGKVLAYVLGVTQAAATRLNAQRSDAPAVK
jgi:hypothetical protein